MKDMHTYKISDFFDTSIEGEYRISDSKVINHMSNDTIIEALERRVLTTSLQRAVLDLVTDRNMIIKKFLSLEFEKNDPEGSVIMSLKEDIKLLRKRIIELEEELERILDESDK